MPDTHPPDSPSWLDGLAMQVVEFSVPGLRSSAEGLDLSNALNSLSGVNRIAVDLAGPTVTVEFDSGHLSAESLRAAIGKSGYPVAPPAEQS